MVLVTRCLAIAPKPFDLCDVFGQVPFVVCPSGFDNRPLLAEGERRDSAQAPQSLAMR